MLDNRDIFNFLTPRRVLWSALSKYMKKVEFSVIIQFGPNIFSNQSAT